MARFEVNTHETSDIAAAGGTPDALFDLGLIAPGATSISTS